MINHILFLPSQQATSRFERFYDLQTATLYTWQPRNPNDIESTVNRLTIQSAAGVKDNVITLHAGAADGLRNYLRSIAMPINVDGNHACPEKISPTQEPAA